jgi:hypothetical protein
MDRIGVGSQVITFAKSGEDDADSGRRGGLVHWGEPPPGAVLREVLAYWRKQCASRAMPSRQDLDPLDIPSLLGGIMLADVMQDPIDFRYRLIGTGIADRLSRDDTGAHFSLLADHGRSSAMFALASAIARGKGPGWADIPYFGANPCVLGMRILGMPLGEKGGPVNMLFFGVEFEVLAAAPITG